MISGRVPDGSTGENVQPASTEHHFSCSGSAMCTYGDSTLFSCLPKFGDRRAGACRKTKSHQCFLGSHPPTCLKFVSIFQSAVPVLQRATRSGGDIVGVRSFRALDRAGNT